MQLSQDYFSGITDMLTDREIKIHPTTNELYGIHEYVVQSKEQLIELCAIIDEKRVTTATGMN